MRRKLFTPINIGTFDLQHRIVLEWPQFTDPLDVTSNPFVPPLDPYLSGGLVICDPGPLIWPGLGPVAAGESDRITLAWRNVIDDAKLSRQSVLARLRADLSSHVPDRRQGILVLKHGDVGDIIRVYVDAARRAKSIGFDGVELDGSFGGGEPISERSSFVVELVEALTQAFGRERVGIRLPPFEARVRSNVYDKLLRCLYDHEIAYINLGLTEQFAKSVLRSSPSAKTLRSAYPGIFITSGQQGLHFAMELVESRWADAVCFSGPQIDAQFLRQLQQEGFDGT
jgi:2,4-dienoyl-CoA reductase-like NADH-dependent reductase (Old Yellow Enzyme family)